MVILAVILGGLLLGTGAVLLIGGLFDADFPEGILGVLAITLGIMFIAIGMTYDNDQAKTDLTRQGFVVTSVDTDKHIATVETKDHCLVGVTITKGDTDSHYLVVDDNHVLGPDDVTCNTK